MRIGRKTLAALLAALVLTMAACQSENKNLIGDDTSSDALSNETSSAEEQAQNQGNFSFTTTDMNGDKVSFENYRPPTMILFNM